jgi:myosin heavy subunit
MAKLIHISDEIYRLEQSIKRLPTSWEQSRLCILKNELIHLRDIDRRMDIDAAELVKLESLSREVVAVAESNAGLERQIAERDREIAAVQAKTRDLTPERNAPEHDAALVKALRQSNESLQETLNGAITTIRKLGAKT